jgi:hypothetical protein
MAPTVDGGFQLKGNEGITMLNGNQTELARREANLIAIVEKILPDFGRACRGHDNTVVNMHQDAFAAD